MTSLRRACIATWLLPLGCDAAEPDAAAESTGADADGAELVEIAAPMVLELDGAPLRILDAELADGRTGVLELYGDVIDVAHGQVAVIAKDRARGEERLVLEDRDGVRRVAAALPVDDGHGAADAELGGLELWGFERAVLHGPRGAETLVAPIVVDAVGLQWRGAALRIVATSSRAQAESAAGGMGGAAFGQRRAAIRVGAISETAHADAGGAPLPSALADRPHASAAPGDPCQDSESCDEGLICVADTVTSDGAFRCLDQCVAPAPAQSIEPLVASTTAVCVDDGGCCDGALECRNGECVVREGGGGGVAPSSSAGGCDPDGDNVISACDPKPNESCTADQDGDGCNDSFDDDDGDSCRCAVRFPRPNGMAIGMMVLGFLHGRRRRR